MYTFFSSPSTNRGAVLRSARFGFLLLLAVIWSVPAFAQAPSSIIPDLSKFKLTFPLDEDGNDYAGVSYNNRSNPLIKAWERDNLVNWTAPGSTSNNNTYRYYFFASGNEVVFRAHCAGALTSANAYPRCELRETPNGGDNFWNFNDEQELNARFRITRVPNEKREVCVIQIKGRVGSESPDEALRLDYRQDGSQGLHLVWNEDNTINDIMDYSVGNTIVANVRVDNKRVYVTLNNVNVSGSRGQYSYNYAVPYNSGYFKAGAYTQSSIWSEKTGKADESPNAYAEVRFTSLTLGGGGGGGSSCVATVPGNRRVTNVGTTSARLDWADVANFDHYKARYRRTGTSTWIRTSGSIRNGSFWNISGLSPNTTYQWQVRSKCANGSASSYTWGPNFTTSSSGSSNRVVTIRKRNAQGYGIDGGNGGGNNQNVYLWSYNANNNNQRWIEIDRGGGYFTYQKVNTNYCLDGGNGGARNQNLKIYSCNASNQNQHWRKVNVGNGYVRLEKRNASAYNINGGSGGGNGQNVNIYDNTSSYNVHWLLTQVGTTSQGSLAAPGAEVNVSEDQVATVAGAEAGHLSFWPNPTAGEITILLPPTTTTRTTSVTVTDLMGRTVFRETGLVAGERFIMSTPLPKGTYLLRWSDDKGQTLQMDRMVRQ